MLHVHTIGRIGKDCQVISGAHGSFMAMDIAVDDYSKGQNITTWIRVRSNKDNHIRLSEYLTKGRLILVDGTLSSSLWKDKNGESQIQALHHGREYCLYQYRKAGRRGSRRGQCSKRSRRRTRSSCRFPAGRKGGFAFLIRE